MKSEFSAEEVRVLCAAYDEIIAGLDLRRVPLPLGDAFARKVLAVARNGERDQERIIERVYLEVGITPHRRRGSDRRP